LIGSAASAASLAITQTPAAIDDIAATVTNVTAECAKLGAGFRLTGRTGIGVDGAAEDRDNTCIRGCFEFVCTIQVRINDLLGVSRSAEGSTAIGACGNIIGTETVITLLGIDGVHAVIAYVQGACAICDDSPAIGNGTILYRRACPGTLI
jgi:hypothetical protein